MRGPVATCKHVFINGAHDHVRFSFHCRKDCPWFTCEHSDVYPECDWRDTGNPAMCCHVQAQIGALRSLAEAATKQADELEADL